MDAIKITIPGEPCGKGRPRMTKAGRTYTPRNTREYENSVVAAYHEQCGGMRFERNVPLDVRLTAYFSIPQSKREKMKRLMREKQIRPTKKPDFDNIEKIVFDALNGLAFYDDAQIVDAQTRKYYDDNPRVVVTIREVEA